MYGGKILSIDTPAAISAAYGDTLFAVKANNMSTLLKSLPNFKEVLQSYPFGEYAHVSVKKDMENPEQELKDYLGKKDLGNVEIKPIKASVEDCFIKLMR
jgi:hypothetical protein